MNKKEEKKLNLGKEALDDIFSRNSLLHKQSVLLLGAEIVALLKKNEIVVSGNLEVLIFIVKLSASLLVASIAFFTLSSFNFYNSKMSLLVIESDKEADDVKQSLKFFVSCGKLGIFFWRLGSSGALVAIMIFLYQV